MRDFYATKNAIARTPLFCIHETLHGRTSLVKICLFKVFLSEATMDYSYFYLVCTILKGTHIVKYITISPSAVTIINMIKIAYSSSQRNLNIKYS